MPFRRRLLLIGKWAFTILFSLFVLLLLLFEGFDRYLASERGARWLYADNPYGAMEIRRTASGLRYVSIGSSDKTPLLLIHGAPGFLYDWKAFSKNERLYSQYRLLIAERPGYGGTRPRGAEPSIQVQAERLLEVLDQEEQAAVVMGHSYGAPIAVAMGALAPERIERVIGVSGQYDPDNEVIFGISYLIRYRIFKYLLPRMVWVSNEEKLGHPEALREVMGLFEQVRVPVVLIHGDADTLVPYANSPFLKEKLPAEATLITVEGGDHPLHMQAADYLAEVAMDAAGPAPDRAGEEEVAR